MIKMSYEERVAHGIVIEYMLEKCADAFLANPDISDEELTKSAGVVVVGRRALEFLLKLWRSGKGALRSGGKKAIRMGRKFRGKRPLDPVTGHIKQYVSSKPGLLNRIGGSPLVRTFGGGAAAAGAVYGVNELYQSMVDPPSKLKLEVGALPEAGASTGSLQPRTEGSTGMNPWLVLGGIPLVMLLGYYLSRTRKLKTASAVKEASNFAERIHEIALGELVKLSERKKQAKEAVEKFIAT